MIKYFWSKTSLTFKITFVILTLITGAFITVLTAQKAMAANLKSVSVINDDVLRLGDIFDGITRNADYVIGAAPKPGQDMVLNARTLYRIAVAMDLPWRPQTTGDQIVIRREATVVSYPTIENTLRNELKKKGVQGNFKVNLNNGKPTMILPKELPEHVEISSIEYDTQKDYFKASLVAPSRENPVRKIDVNGFVERLVKVPVLRTNLRNGDIIGENDVELIEVSQKNLQHDLILDKEDLIGMTPRRFGYAGKMVLAGTLERPQLVERGDKVTIAFKEGPLLLTAKGRALQSGAKGDLIRIKNINSSRAVDAIVVGQNHVAIR
jgi:flagella basal body P-ring formation protein FlgA